MKKPILFTIIILSLMTVANGQSAAVYEQERRELDARQKTLNDWIEKSENQRQPHTSGLPTKTNKLSKEDKIKLTPPQEDSEKYTHFLKGKNTGIVKLFHFPNCDRRVVNVNDTKCLEAPQIIGNGSLYSFSTRSYLDLRSIDIKLGDEKFSVWSPLNYALFSELGDISLETFDFTKDVQSLKKFAVAKDISQLSAQQKQFEAGVEIGGRLYKNDVLVKTDTTYLLRSGKHRFYQKGFDEIIVAFRVIRKNVDGSVVLIWKELS